MYTIMEEEIRYSSDQLRSVQAQCSALLKVIEKRAEHIVQLSKETARDCPAIDNAMLLVTNNNLLYGIRNYHVQLDHLTVAADLYDQCNVKLYEIVEQTLKTGGDSH